MEKAASWRAGRALGLAKFACTAGCRYDTSSCLQHECGNGTAEPQNGEECDGTDLRSQDCLSQGFSGGQLACGVTCLYDTSACVALCGNGLPEPTEGCDDQNLTSGDGCTDLCQVEPGWQCSGTPSVCYPLCGDGLVVGPEAAACDDGDTQGGDGCSATCAVEHGYTCVDAPSVCTPQCGDGLVAGGLLAEACDDGDTQSSDGCSSACLVEHGYYCSNEPSACVTGCDDPDCDALCGACGDLTCGAGETCRLCPQDCGACAVTCGDFVCDPGETIASCPADCH